MIFQVHALCPQPFAKLFALADAALARRNARRCVADVSPGYPCRVSLVDAEPGEMLILVHHVHLAEDTPYRASHAIYIREGALQANLPPATLPRHFEMRTLSVRAFAADHMMRDADLADASRLPTMIETYLADPATA